MNGVHKIDNQNLLEFFFSSFLDLYDDDKHLLIFLSIDILASSNDAGVYLVAEKDGSRFFVTGHPEYDPDTLDKEYHRDLAKCGDCVMPKNYYKNDDVNDEILVKWRSHAYLLFSNWLNYYVYQNTPYNLDDLLKMKTTNK